MADLTNDDITIFTTECMRPLLNKIDEKYPDNEAARYEFYHAIAAHLLLMPDYNPQQARANLTRILAK
jgi:hypothetical protein